LLAATVLLSFILYVILFAAPSGTDVFTHMENTKRMAESNSLSQFIEKSQIEEYAGYDYPFGLWYFGSIAMKLTGLDIFTIAYLIPLLLMAGTLLIYYVYAFEFLSSRDQSILSLVFFISMPMIALSMINLSTSVFVSSFLVLIIYAAIRPADWINWLLIVVLVFTLCFSHTGTFLFLLSLAIVYFLLRALIWNVIDQAFYFLVIAMLFSYTTIVQIFPFIQPQYIDKGTLILSTTSAISSALNTDIIQSAGEVFYNSVLVSNNYIFAFLWSAMVFATAKMLLYTRKNIEEVYTKNIKKVQPASIPIIGNVTNLSKGIMTTPIWVGPIHTLLSIVGIFKIDERGKCLALTLIITALIPGSLGSSEGTGALREISYLFLLIPITSVIGLYMILPKVEEFAITPVKKIAATFLYLIIFVSLIAVPVVACLHYQPTLTMTNEEKTNLLWLGTVGYPSEGAVGNIYRERMTLYANKTIPSIPSGRATVNFQNYLYDTYFSDTPEQSTRDLSMYQIKYLIASHRTMKEYNESEDILKIDENRQADKVFASGKFFGIYSIIPSPPVSVATIREPITWKEGSLEKIQNAGSVFLVENDYYKVKLSDKSPTFVYLGPKTKNVFGEGGGYTDSFVLFWQYPDNATSQQTATFDLSNLNYPEISHSDNIIKYKTTLVGANETDKLATLTVKYVFYNQAIRRDIILANDRTDVNQTPMLTAIVYSIFNGPIDNFEYYRTDTGEWLTKKIFPAADWSSAREAPFNGVYFNESSTGLYHYYHSTSPEPSGLAYLGTDYQYGLVYSENSYSFEPSEPLVISEFFVIGSKNYATNCVEKYTSVSPYNFKNGQIPVIVTGSADDTNSSEIQAALSQLNTFKIPYTQAVSTNGTSKLIQGSTAPLIGSLVADANNTYKPVREQERDITNLTAKSIKGVFTPTFEYDMTTVRLLNRNKMLDAVIIGQPPVDGYRYTYGYRDLKFANINGEETNLVLMPVTLPRKPENDGTFFEWNNTLDSVKDRGGIVVFAWDIKDIVDPVYSQRIKGVLRRTVEDKFTPSDPDSVAEHYRKMKNISVTVQSGDDYVILEAINPSATDVVGATYRVDLPTISGGCPYTVMNGTVSRSLRDNETCCLFVSFDIRRWGSKNVVINTNVVKDTFVVDLPGLYEGKTPIVVLNSRRSPVPHASVVIGTEYYLTDDEGRATVSLLEGINIIRIQKAGFEPYVVNTTVKPRIYRYLPLDK